MFFTLPYNEFVHWSKKPRKMPWSKTQNGAYMILKKCSAKATPGRMSFGVLYMYNDGCLYPALEEFSDFLKRHSREYFKCCVWPILIYICSPTSTYYLARRKHTLASCVVQSQIHGPRSRCLLFLKDLVSQGLLVRRMRVHVCDVHFSVEDRTPGMIYVWEFRSKRMRTAADEFIKHMLHVELNSVFVWNRIDGFCRTFLGEVGNSLCGNIMFKHILFIDFIITAEWKHTINYFNLISNLILLELHHGKRFLIMYMPISEHYKMYF